MRSFVGVREWNKFHTPRNLVLALMGEAGELSEIFQWKGNTSPEDILNYEKKELMHIGEEISDVFIYNLRLSDLTGIDIAQTVQVLLDTKGTVGHNSRLFSSSYPDGPWTDLQFSEMKAAVRGHESLLKIAPRELVLRINASVGTMCSIIASYSEEKCELNIPEFSLEHREQLAVAMGNVAVFLEALAQISGLDISDCISDKLAKNNRKYPAELVKGSAAKYTFYRGVAGGWRGWTTCGSVLTTKAKGLSTTTLLLIGSSLLGGVILLGVADMAAIKSLGGYPQGSIVST